MPRRKFRFATLMLALLSAGCGGDSERVVPVCRNAWREVPIPKEYARFQAWAGTWHKERLYLFKADPLDGSDPYPDGPVGLVFDPPDRFRAITSEGRPYLARLSATVPLGQEIVVTTGEGPERAFGSRYDTVSDSWTPLEPLAGAALDRLAATPMGEEMFAVHYSGNSSVDQLESPNYHAWNAASGWRTISTPPAAGNWVGGVWTGREVIAWGEHDPLDHFEAPAAIRYQPGTDTWSPVSMEGAPELASDYRGVWTGREFVTYGGRYYPDRDAWEPISEDGAVWGVPFQIGRRVLFWRMSAGEAQGAVYDAELDSWGPPVTVRCLDQSGSARVPVWIDDGLFVWNSWDRAQYLRADAILGEVSEDPPGCACPAPLGAK